MIPDACTLPANTGSLLSMAPRKATARTPAVGATLPSAHVPAKGRSLTQTGPPGAVVIFGVAKKAKFLWQPGSPSILTLGSVFDEFANHFSDFDQTHLLLPDNLGAKPSIPAALRWMTACYFRIYQAGARPVSYTHLRAHETGRNLVC